MSRALSEQEKDRIWTLFHSLSTGRRRLVNQQNLGMAMMDVVVICCHLSQQNAEQAAAAKKVLRTLLNAYEQDGIKTACDLVIRKLGTDAHEIAALAASHLEVARAFPVTGGDHE